jgi:hypothetical protein
MKKYPIFKIIILMAAIIIYTGCSDDSSGPKKQSDFIIQVLSSSDSSAIVNANIVLYNADNNEAITRDATNSEGFCTFDIDEGNYYVKISAQDFKSSPPANNAAIPFAVVKSEDVTRVKFQVIFIRSLVMF